MQLPPELAEKVLLETPNEDLFSLCRSSQLYNDICHSPSFWRERFGVPPSSLVKSTDLTLSQWIDLDKRVEEAAEYLQERVTGLKDVENIFIYLTGSPEEQEALKTPGINYYLYESLLPRIDKVNEEFKWITGEIEFYHDKYKKSGDLEDEEQAFYYQEFRDKLEGFFPTLEVFYKDDEFYYSLSPTTVRKTEYPLTEEEIEELIFRMTFFDLDYMYE